MDEWPGDTERPWTLNKYNYVENSPLSLRDPSGMSSLGEQVGVQAVMAELRQQAVKFTLKRFVFRKAFIVYFGIGRGIGSRSKNDQWGADVARSVGHAFIFVKPIGFSEGVYMDANPEGNFADALRGKEVGGIIGGEKMSYSNAKQRGNLREVSKLSPLGYILWRAAIKSLPTASDLLSDSLFENRSRRYQMGSAPFLSDTINCYSWAVEAAALGWLFGRL